MHHSYPPNFHYCEFPSASCLDDEPSRVPVIDSFWPRSQLLSSEDYLPTPAHCGVHLELLECFHALKERVMGSEQIDHALGSCSPPDTLTGAAEQEGQHQIGIIEHREMRWHAFLELAVQRFEIWWRMEGTLGPDGQSFDERAEMLENNREFGFRGNIHELTADRLPPLGETDCDSNSVFLTTSI